MNICQLCQVILWLFLAQWLEGRRRHVNLRERVIRHKTLKPQILHLLWKSDGSTWFHVSLQNINLLINTFVRKDLVHLQRQTDWLCWGCLCQSATALYVSSQEITLLKAVSVSLCLWLFVLNHRIVPLNSCTAVWFNLDLTGFKLDLA